MARAVGVLTANIFHTKIIDDEQESNWASDMVEEAWGVFGLLIAKGGKVGSKAAIGKDASLRETVHSLSN